jgi:hypothetical protein
MFQGQAKAPNDDLRHTLLQRIHLQVLSGADVMHKDAVASDVHQALLALAGSIASNWRCQQHLAAAIPALPGLLSQEVLCEHWTPYSFDLLLTGEAMTAGCGSLGSSSCCIV